MDHPDRSNFKKSKLYTSAIYEAIFLIFLIFQSEARENFKVKNVDSNYIVVVSNFKISSGTLFRIQLYVSSSEPAILGMANRLSVTDTEAMTEQKIEETNQDLIKELTLAWRMYYPIKGGIGGPELGRSDC